MTQTNWNPNCGGLSFLEHHIKYRLEGLKEHVPKQKGLNILADPQRPDEDFSEFLERICQAFRRYADADTQAQENV